MLISHIFLLFLINNCALIFKLIFAVSNKHYPLHIHIIYPLLATHLQFYQSYCYILVYYNASSIIILHGNYYIVEQFQLIW